MSNNVITLLLADDHGLVRSGFRRLLEDEPDLRVVGEAADGPQAVKAAKRLRPDVVVMDFALPGMNGAQATKHILTDVPGTAVLILSMYSEPSCVRASLDAGAAGYLLKSALDLDLVRVVREIAGGARQVLDPRLAPAPENMSRSLTPRELEVLQHIVYGKSNKEIALELGLSVNTVSVHRAKIMKALAIRRTSGLVVYAVRNGLVKLG